MGYRYNPLEGKFNLYNLDGGGATVVANYSALPAPGTVTGQFYWAEASQGTAWLPGSLGGTYYPAGEYYSNGVAWQYSATPYNATQGTVNAGLVADQFVAPTTLKAWPGSTNITTVGTISTGTWQGTAVADAYISSAATWNAKESALTFTSGLSRSVNTVTNDVLTGKAGGQTWIGGTAAGDGLTIKGTSGSGTAALAGITLGVGSNGGTVAATVYNSGNFNIGNASNTNARILAIGQDTAFAYMGSNAGVGASAQFAIYGNQTTPSGTNYTITTTSGLTVLNNPTAVSIRIAGVNEKIGMTTSQTSFSQGATSSGVVTPFLFTTPASTGQTAGTETIGIDINMGATIQHASNTLIATQRDSVIRPRTHSFATTGGSMTNVATMAIVGPPIQGTNWNAGTPNLMALWVQAGASQFDGLIKVNSGVNADGGGLKHQRVTTGSVNAGATALVTVTWTTAFANANYTVNASVVDSTTAAASLSVVHIESIAAGSVTVRVENTSAGSLTGTLQVIALHD